MTENLNNQQAAMESELFDASNVAGYGGANMKTVDIMQANNADKTTWEDLRNAGVSRDDVAVMFRKRFGRVPNHVYLNEGICLQYNHHCYNSASEAPTYHKPRIQSVSKSEDSKLLSNDPASPAESKYSVKLRAQKNRSATVSITETSSYTYSEKIVIGSAGLGLQAEFSGSFSLENSVGSTRNTSETLTVEDSVEVTLKPGDQVRVDLTMTWKTLNANFEIPISIKGWAGAEYSKPVNGHHYWFLKFGDDVPKSSIRGTAECAYDISGNISVHPA